MPPSPKLTDPTLGVAPVSHPTGEPIAVQAVAPAIGSEETVTFSSHKLLEIRGAKHQENEQHARVRVKVLGVDGVLATKLEVTTQEAKGTIQVERNRELNDLLEGVYTVTRGSDGSLQATRADGTSAAPEDQQSLDVLVADRLYRDDGMEMLLEHPLRVGETVPIELDVSVELYGAEPKGTYTLTLVSADAATATYQINFEVKATEPNLIGDIDLKGRRTFVLDRARGRITKETLVTYKTERHPERATDELSEQSIERAP